jgi:hypothetical protein
MRLDPLVPDSWSPHSLPSFTLLLSQIPRTSDFAAEHESFLTKYTVPEGRYPAGQVSLSLQSVIAIRGTVQPATLAQQVLMRHHR